MIRVALVQVDVDDVETPGERVERVARTVEGLSDVDLVVLPELWHVGAFDLDAARENAEPVDGGLQRLAVELKLRPSRAYPGDAGGLQP